MGNFLRRTIAFVLGMIFMLVLIVGSIAGVGYWAFKNLSLNDLGVTQDGVTSGGLDLGDMGEWSVEDWAAVIIEAQNDPRGFTFKKLEESGFDFNGFLTSLGIDVANANQNDLDCIKETSIAMLFGDGGFNEVNFGAVLAFLPVDAETGKYPVFSDGARNILRNYTVGEFGKIDPVTGNSRAYSILRQLKIGSVFTESFDEAVVDGKYVYSSQNKALDLFANVELALITDAIETGEGFDLGYQVNEGYLTNVGDIIAKEVIAMLISGEDEEGYQSVVDGMSFFSDVKFKELFVYNEETETYTFTLESAFSDVTLGVFMGNKLCSESDDCKVHESIALCDGNFYDADNNLVEMAPVEKKIMTNLYGITITDLIEGGFELANIVDGVFLGESFGYSIGSAPAGSEYCNIDCTVEDVEHEHNYYFVDGEGKFVGEMYNKLSNQTMVDAINGNLDLVGIIDTTMIGEMLGYKYDETLLEWVDDNGVAVRRETATDKVLYNLYDKTINELNGDLSMSEVLQGISFGELMGYNKCLGGTGCDIHVDEANCDGKWYNGNEVASPLYQPLCSEELSSLIDGTVDIEDVIGVLYVGELMGHTYVEEGDYWVDSNGDRLNDVNNLVADIKLSEIFEGSLDLNEKVQDLTLGAVVDIEGNNILSLLKDTKIKNISIEMNELEVGEMMGYKKGEIPAGVTGFCAADCDIVEGHVHSAACGECDIEENHDHHYYWVEENGEHVSGITSKLDDLTVKELSEGEFENIKFTLGDVIDGSHLNSGVFSLIDNDTNGDGVDDYANINDIPTGQISGRITSGVNKSSYQNLVDANVIDGLEEEEMSTLDKLFYTIDNEDENGDKIFETELDAREYWTGLSVTNLMSETVNKIHSLMSKIGM